MKGKNFTNNEIYKSPITFDNDGKKVLCEVYKTNDKSINIKDFK